MAYLWTGVACYLRGNIYQGPEPNTEDNSNAVARVLVVEIKF